MLHRKIIFIGLGVLTVIAAGGSYYYQTRLQKTGFEAYTEITNTATLRYCLPNDSVAQCDPANNLFSGEKISNSTKTTVSTSTLPPGKIRRR